MRCRRRTKWRRMFTAFLMRWYRSSGSSGARPAVFRIRRILEPVMEFTCAMPRESRSTTPMADGVMPFLALLKISSFTCRNSNRRERQATRRTTSRDRSGVPSQARFCTKRAGCDGTAAPSGRYLCYTQPTPRSEISSTYNTQRRTKRGATALTRECACDPW
jgi:hypothetical protein